MWICSTIGFFSLVQKDKPGQWQVRARVRRDLENLCREINMPKSRIVSTRNGDYAFRLIIDQNELNTIFAVLPKLITYQNFKNAVAARPDQREHERIYHKWWGDMLALQPAGTGIYSRWPSVERTFHATEPAFATRLAKAEKKAAKRSAKRGVVSADVETLVIRIVKRFVNSFVPVDRNTRLAEVIDDWDHTELLPVLRHEFGIELRYDELRYETALVQDVVDVVVRKCEAKRARKHVADAEKLIG